MNAIDFWKQEWNNVTTTDAVSNATSTNNLDWPPKWWTSTKAKWDRLNYKEKRIILWDPQWYKVFDIEDTANTALEETKKEFGIQGKGDESDAFRHLLWQALNVQTVGESFTRKWSDAHEYSTPRNEIPHLFMDIHNNDLGIEIGKANPNATLDELKAIIILKISQGEAIVLDSANKLLLSDGKAASKADIRRYAVSEKIAKEVKANSSSGGKNY